MPVMISADARDVDRDGDALRMEGGERAACPRGERGVDGVVVRAREPPEQPHGAPPPSAEHLVDDGDHLVLHPERALVVALDG